MDLIAGPGVIRRRSLVTWRTSLNEMPSHGQVGSFGGWEQVVHIFMYICTYSFMEVTDYLGYASIYCNDPNPFSVALCPY